MRWAMTSMSGSIELGFPKAVLRKMGVRAAHLSEPVAGLGTIEIGKTENAYPGGICYVESLTTLALAFGHRAWPLAHRAGTGNAMKFQSSIRPATPFRAAARLGESIQGKDGGQARIGLVCWTSIVLTRRPSGASRRHSRRPTSPITSIFFRQDPAFA